MNIKIFSVWIIWDYNWAVACFHTFTAFLRLLCGVFSLAVQNVLPKLGNYEKLWEQSCRVPNQEYDGGFAAVRLKILQCSILHTTWSRTSTILDYTMARMQISWRRISPRVRSVWLCVECCDSFWLKSFCSLGALLMVAYMWHQWFVEVLGI